MYCRFVLPLAALVSAFASADQARPISAEETLALFETPPDVRVELVAAEPEVIDPVALAFDERGRLFVVENRGYPVDDSGQGRVVLLEDTDGDGRHEQRTEFATGFDFPNGLMPWRGGLLLTCAPHIYFLKDTDGDNVADVKEVVLTGFAPGGSTQLRVSHPMLGLDNWIYLTNGLSGGDITDPATPDKPPVTMGTQDLRWNPLTHAIETVSGQAQFGQAFDDYGNKFVCSNRKHIEHAVLEAEDLARNPYLEFSQTVADIPDHGGASPIFAISEGMTTAFAHAGTFTAACGLVIYRGDALTAHYRGQSFTCDPTGNLIHRDRLEPHGATFVALREDENTEFLRTKDNWFRPVFLANAPDGALYLCDMYRQTIEHPTYLPPEVAAITNFDGGKDRGRIYRIIGAKPIARPHPSDPSDPANLASPNAWTADTAHRLLLERQDAAESPALTTLLQSSPSDTARIHALYLLHALNLLDAKLLADALQDAHPRVREHALRLARELHLLNHELIEPQLFPLAEDSDARIRFQVALALGDPKHPIPRTTPDRDPVLETPAPRLAEIYLQGAADPFLRAAVLSSASTCLTEFGSRIATKSQPHPDEHFATISQMIARGEWDEALEFMDQLFPNGGSPNPEPWQISAVRGFLDGVSQNDEFAGFDSAVQRTNFKMLASANGYLGFRGALSNTVTNALDKVSSNVSSMALRIESARLLRHSDFTTAGTQLAALLTPQTHPDLQVPALQALARFDAPEVASLLTAKDTWRAYTAPVRAAALAALVTRPDRAALLLDAVERGDVPLWSIDATSRNHLLNLPDQALKEKAANLFAQAPITSRGEAYTEYRPLLELTPNIANGKVIFTNNCTPCHRYDGLGHEVGPDLTGIRSQALESILLHIIDPNWLMVAGFENYEIETVDAEFYSGLITSQSETSITLKQAQGIEKTILRKDIASLTCANLSMMPEELEKAMSKQEIRDLLGFLKGE